MAPSFLYSIFFTFFDSQFFLNQRFYSHGILISINNNQTFLNDSRKSRIFFESHFHFSLKFIKIHVFSLIQLVAVEIIERGEHMHTHFFIRNTNGGFLESWSIQLRTNHSTIPLHHPLFSFISLLAYIQYSSIIYAGNPLH